MDGDGQNDPNDFPALLALVLVARLPETRGIELEGTLGAS